MLKVAPLLLLMGQRTTLATLATMATSLDQTVTEGRELMAPVADGAEDLVDVAGIISVISDHLIEFFLLPK